VAASVAATAAVALQAAKGISGLKRVSSVVKDTANRVVDAVDLQPAAAALARLSLTVANAPRQLIRRMSALKVCTLIVWPKSSLSGGSVAVLSGLTMINLTEQCVYLPGVNSSTYTWIN
jgi:hypothetical protein